jgi:TPR repeat protein
LTSNLFQESAQLYIANLHYNGHRTVPVNHDVAHKYYTQAALRGNKEAKHQVFFWSVFPFVQLVLHTLLQDLAMQTDCRAYSTTPHAAIGSELDFEHVCASLLTYLSFFKFLSLTLLSRPQGKGICSKYFRIKKGFFSNPSISHSSFLPDSQTYIP